MGSVKPLVCVGGKAILELTLAALFDSRVDEIIVVLGHSAELIQQSVKFGRARSVMNESYREGIASSLRAGIASVSTQADAALIVLADQPFLQSQTIDRLIDEYRSKKPEIIVPTFKGFRGNPVLLDRCVFGELAELTGDVGCRAIFAGHAQGLMKVAVEDAGILVDLDTPQDVQRFEQSSGEYPPESRLFEQADLSGRDSSAPQLIVVGQGPVAMALIEFAPLLEFDVVLVDPFARAEESPKVAILRVLDFSLVAPRDETFMVVTSRGRFDEEAIEQALEINPVYIALLANKRRGEEIQANLRAKGISEEKLARVRIPAGLDIGAVTPAEIALSILAELVSNRRRKRSI